MITITSYIADDLLVMGNYIPDFQIVSLGTLLTRCGMKFIVSKKNSTMGKYLLLFPVIRSFPNYSSLM